MSVPQVHAQQLHQVVTRALADHGGQPGVVGGGPHPGALLPVLHAIVDALGYVPPAAIEPVARGLNLSKADVHGVVSFYADFRTTPPGRHRLRICRAEACQAMGSDALADHIARAHGCAVGETRSDGAFSVEAVYCLGNCALPPAVMVDHDELVGRATPARIDAIVGAWGAP